MAEEKSLGVVYVEPNRLLFYSASINKVLFQDFPPDTVSDLDIINKDKFTQILNFFIQNALQKKIFNLALVFSQQTTFEKMLVPTISKDADALFSEFSSLVPFEEVMSRVYKENKQIKAYAINKIVYEFIVDCFTKNGSDVSIVLPASLIVEKSPELSNNFDLPSLAGKVESLKAFNMVDLSFGSRIQPLQSSGGKNKNKRVYVLGVVFVVLLMFMIIFAYMTFFGNQDDVKNNSKNTTVTTAPVQQPENFSEVQPTITPVISATPSPALIQKTATKSSGF